MIAHLASPPVAEGPLIFATTRWSVVLKAGAAPDGRGDAALDQLCRTYWPPLFAYARRRGQSLHDAQDSVQGFLLELTRDNAFARADPQRGRFRSFLLGAFQRYLADQWERARTLKRGGEIEFLTFDAAEFERVHGLDWSEPATPERAFEERWALTVVEEALGSLEREAQERGREAVFRRLRPFLLGQADASDYPEAARDLGLSESLLPTMLHRLRREFGVRLRREVAQTLDDPTEVEAEVRHLREVLGAVWG
ncbi:MAG: sigma-70 family RNA polymerase sigma factor [Verrucomicrobia bacterium]|nr:sigma-70 family RNA polymerase sigma factor [Verrucomicrobiota bacterium]